MKSIARLDGHPIHPMLVTFPIGLWITGFIFHLISVGTAAPFWFKVAQYNYFAGLIGAALAAVAGFVDFLGLPLTSDERKIASTHMMLNVVIVVLFAFTVGIMWSTPAAIGWQMGALLVLPVLGLLALLYSGWLGASLVHDHGVSVAEEVCQEIMGAQAGPIRPGIAGAKGGQVEQLPPQTPKQEPPPPPDPGKP